MKVAKVRMIYELEVPEGYVSNYYDTRTEDFGECVARYVRCFVDLSEEDDPIIEIESIKEVEEY